VSGAARWPGDAPYALCLTHDVDRVRKQAYHYLGYGLTGGGGGRKAQLRSLARRLLGEEPYWNFPRLMRLEDQLGVRSTFLFLDETARGLSPAFLGRYRVRQPAVADAIRTLHRAGWEVGLHGSWASFSDLELLRREKATLEDVLGETVRSTRQHFLHLCPDTWRFQAEVGLEVDSTVGSALRVWDPDDGTLPYWHDANRLLELPVTVMDTVGLHDPEIRRRAEAVFDHIASVGGVVTLDWHHRTFAPGEYPQAVELYLSLVQRARSDGAYVATMGEIVDHWRLVEPPQWQPSAPAP